MPVRYTEIAEFILELEIKEIDDLVQNTSKHQNTEQLLEQLTD